MRIKCFRSPQKSLNRPPDHILAYFLHESSWKNRPNPMLTSALPESPQIRSKLEQTKSQIKFMLSRIVVRVSCPSVLMLDAIQIVSSGGNAPCESREVREPPGAPMSTAGIQFYPSTHVLCLNACERDMFHTSAINPPLGEGKSIIFVPRG